MTSWLASTEEIPPGAHALAFWATEAEEERKLLRFVSSAADYGQPAIWLTRQHDPERLARYRAELSARALPGFRVIRPISGAQAPLSGPVRRPVPDGPEFAAQHPGGATLVGDTIPDHLNSATLSEWLEYERWFDGLRPFPHRALCPYDLGRLPVDRAHEAIVDLAAHHTHVVLSESTCPAVRLLQLLLVPRLNEVPVAFARYLRRGVARRLLDIAPSGDGVGLSLRGEQIVRAFARRAGTAGAGSAAPGGAFGRPSAA